MFDSYRMLIEQNDSYLYAKLRTEINGEMMEFLHVAGVQSEANIDPTEICKTAFADATKGEQFLENKKLPNFVIKTQALPGLRK